MAQGKAGTGGVHVARGKVRVTFRKDGKPHNKGLDLKATAANRKYAERLVNEIKDKIRLGTFRWKDYFPDSKEAKEEEKNLATATPDTMTFGQFCEKYMDSKGQLSENSKSQYRNALEFWKRMFGENTPIDKVDALTVKVEIGKYPWPSARLYNNYMIPLRGVFELATTKFESLKSPVLKVKNQKKQVNPPDPLSMDEAKRIIEDMREHHDERVLAYFVFAFATGMRPEELIALKWHDVDWAHRTVRVERAKTFRGTVKGTKTENIRDVDLVEQALQALEVMRPYTYGKQGSEDYIFENPVTDKPWHDERSQRDHYWKPTLKRLSIRQRRAYQTRHTYATIALMAGLNPSYIARQMGHANTKMLYSTYAKWIDGADRGRERAKLENAMKAEETLKLA